MSLSTVPSTLIHDERGITLVEMLIATVSGVVLMLALFAILTFSVGQSDRIAGKVDATQQGRIALEKLMLEMHSSCVAASVTPVQPGSDDTSIQFISVPGSQASFPTAELHYVRLVGEELIDRTYKSISGNAPAWRFPSVGETPAASEILATSISQSQTGVPAENLPVFRYYRYYKASDPSPVLGSIDPTPLPTPLSHANAESTAEVTVSFTANPTSGNGAGTPGTDQSVDFSDSALMRFNPSSSTANNVSCA